MTENDKVLKMNIKTTTNSPTNVTINVSVDQEVLTKNYHLVLSQLKKNLNLPGFRKGMVPDEIALKNIDPKTLENEFLNQTVEQIYIGAVAESKINPIMQPKVNLKKFVPYSQLELSFEVDVISQIDLPALDDIKVNISKNKISEKELNDAIKDFQFNIAERQPKTTEVATGDEVEINFKGFDQKNEPIVGAQAEHYFLIVGSNKFIPGFEEQLIGLKINEEKTFQIKFPKDYFEPSLKNQEVRFEVKVLAINKLILPKVDDELAQKAGQFKTIDEFKKALSDRLLIDKDDQSRQKLETDIVEELLAKTKISLPDNLIDLEIKNYMKDLEKQLQSKNQTVDEFLKEQGLSLEDYTDDRKKMIIRQIKTGIILSELAQKNKISVSDQEFDQQITALKSNYQNDPAMTEQFNNPDNLRDLRNRMLIEKVLNYLIENIQSQHS